MQLILDAWVGLLDLSERLTDVMIEQGAPVIQATQRLLKAYPEIGAQVAPLLPDRAITTFSNLILIVATVSLVLFNIPYTVLYFRPIPFFDQYLIQPKRARNPEERTTREWVGAVGYQAAALFITWLVSFTGSFLTVKLARPDWDISNRAQVLALPTLSGALVDMLKCLIIEDFVFYWAHRALHHPALYARVHKLHHKYKAPFSVTATFATSTEFVVSDVIPLTAGMVLGCRNLFSAMLFVVYRLFLTTEVHSGYSFPWSMENILPRFGIHFLAGPKHHDAHHEKTHGNYASNLFFWDDLCGTTLK